MFIGALGATSTRQDWSEIFQLKDSETGDLIDLTDVTIVVEFREPGHSRPTISADVQIIDTGTFTASLTLAQSRSLCARTYEVGITLERDGETSQQFIGTIPVLDGIVS